MEINSCSAVVDTDFIFHVAETEWPKEKVAEILGEVLHGVGVMATIHPLVFENELLLNNQFPNDKIKWLFDSNTIRKASFEDIFQGSEERKAYYCFLVPELYKRLRGDTYLASGDDILLFWKKKSSFGEIHALSMCLICECGMFLSDDEDSKALKGIIEQTALGDVKVYSRRELLEAYSAAGNTGLNRKDRTAFSHKRSK